MPSIGTRDIGVQKILSRHRTIGQRMPRKMLYQHLPDRSWSGRRCFIIGGGPSLKSFDFSVLKGELIIGLNRAYEWVDCDILFAVDENFYKLIMSGKLGKEAKERFDNFSGMKAWLNMRNYYYGLEIYQIECLGSRGLSFSLENGLYHGGNAGYAGINLAVCLGANPIYLLGYDMKHEGKRTHWHAGYPERQGPGVLLNFKKALEDLAPKLKEKGIRVVNLNPDSALRCFEFSTIDKVLGSDSISNAGR